MLKLYDVEDFNPAGFDVVRDVEEAFAPLRLVNDEVTANLLREIENAEYYSEDRVTDRFGAQIYISEISTGCKAALCVQYLPDKVIDLKECGLNARDAIITYCNRGNALLYSSCTGVESYNKENLDIHVSLKGKEFSRIDDLNDFLGSYEYAK